MADPISTAAADPFVLAAGTRSIGILRSNPANTPYSLMEVKGAPAGDLRIQVPFEYISRKHVYVYQIPPGALPVLVAPANWSWVTDKEILVNAAAVVAGSDYRVQRETYIDQPIVQWKDGSYIIAENLDLSDRQVLYAVQEFLDNVEISLSTSNDALAIANQTVAMANQASIDAAEARRAASVAEDKAVDAEAQSTTANTKSDQALSTANTAKATADTAIQAAAGAQTAALNADAKATQAANSAAQAAQAVSSVAIYVPVPNVAAIPSTPSAGQLTLVVDSTGVQSIPGITGASGFVGDPGRSAKIRWDGTSWVFDGYQVPDPDGRYAGKATEATATAAQAAATQATTTAQAADGKATAAQATATAADSKASTAQTAATQANSNATSALAKATTAETAAGTATTAAAQAQVVANNALPKAGGELTGDVTNTGTGFFELPEGSTAQRPGSPSDGMLRYNNEIPAFEGYQDGAWGVLGGEASGKNLLENGLFQVNQRGIGTSGTVPITGRPLVDRWNVACLSIPAGLTGKVQLFANPPGAPAGVIASMKMTIVTPAPAGSDDRACYFYQPIEGVNVQHLLYGSANAKPLTLSFFAKSSIAGNHSVTLRSSQSATAFRHHINTYRINAVNKWQRVVVTFPGDVAANGKIRNEQDTGLGVLFPFGSGANAPAKAWNDGNLYVADGSVSHTGTANANFEFANVQLEVGTAATPIEIRGFGEEERRCRRHFQRLSQGPYSGVVYLPNGDSRSLISLVPTMRAAPTVLSPPDIAMILIGDKGLATNVNSPVAFDSDSVSVRPRTLTNFVNLASAATNSSMASWGGTFQTELVASAEMN